METSAEKHNQSLCWVVAHCMHSNPKGFIYKTLPHIRLRDCYKREHGMIIRCRITVTLLWYVSPSHLKTYIFAPIWPPDASTFKTRTLPVEFLPFSFIIKYLILENFFFISRNSLHILDPLIYLYSVPEIVQWKRQRYWMGNQEK